MVTFRESFEVFCFSVMESSFCFANVEFVTVPAASFIDDFGSLRSVQAIFVRKKDLMRRVFWNMILRLTKE